MAIPALLLLSYVLLALGLMPNFGSYDPLALALVLASFASLSLAFALLWRKGDRLPRTELTPMFAVALVALLLAGLLKPALLFSEAFTRPYHLWLALFAGLIAGAYMLLRANRRGVRRAVFVIGFIAALAFRVWVPVASPSPVIDTFSVSQEASQYVLEGRNPYNSPVSDVYKGKLNFGYKLKAYVYLPADLYLQTVSYVLTRDVRYVNILAELVAALAIWRLARRRWGESTAECISLLFLYGPRSLYVIEQAWVDPLILMFLGAFVLLRERRPFAAALAYGWMLSLKQYMLFAAVQWLIVERDRKRIAAGLALALLTVLPFLAADWRSFLANGVMFNVLIPFRQDSLTVFSYLYRHWGISPPAGWAVVVGAVLTAVTFVPQRRLEPLRGYLFALTITMLGMFVFGTSGFCNWYYLVCGFMAFLLAAAGGVDTDARAGDTLHAAVR